MGGYVITRPYSTSNVGSNLASLAGALWLAKSLGRGLVVDWRGMSQLAEAQLNYFTEFFATPAAFDGVPTAYAPASAVPDYSSTSDAEWVEPAEARALGLKERPPRSDRIVLETYHGLDRLHPGPESERLRLLRSFYCELRPAPEIEAAIDDWWGEHLDGRFVVGVNVRTGNGHYFRRGERYASRVDVALLQRRSRILRVLERACRDRLRRLPRPLRETAAVFYATDSEEMSAWLSTLPGSITRRRVFPPPGTGDTYAFENDPFARRASVVETVIDMFLLARCDALVYNNSLFNQYARVLTGNFGGNQVQFETMFVRKRVETAFSAIRRRAGRGRRR